MKISGRLIALATMLLVGGMTGVSASYAETISLHLADSDGHVKDVVDGGVGDMDGVVNGAIVSSGGLGDWTVNVTTALGSAAAGPGSMVLNTLDISSSGTTSTLNISFTQTGMMTSYPGWTLGFAGTNTLDNTTATYDAWADDANGAFAMTTLIGSIGPFSTSGFSESVSGLVTVSGPYSLTQRLTVTGGGGSTSAFSTGASLTPVPESNSLVLMGVAIFGMGILGVGRKNRLFVKGL